MQRYIFRVLMIVVAAVVSVTPLCAQRVELRELKGDIESMLERRRWGEARMLLRDFQRGLDPVRDMSDVEWAAYNSVRCAVELGAAEAESMMAHFIEKYPASVYCNSVAFMAASYVCDGGRLDEARDLFDKVDYKALSARERERYDIRVGYIRFLEEDYATAEGHFSKVSRLSEYYPHALYYRSYIAYKREEYDLAAQGFRELMGYDSYRAIAPFYLMQIEYRRCNYDYVITEGAQLLSQASEQTSDDLERIIAESHFIKGDYANAIRYMASYPEERMQRQEYYIKGYSLYRMARYGDAIAPLAKVCGPEDALTQNASYHLGDCYMRVGDKSHAADAFAMASVEGFDADIAEDALLHYGRLKYELGGGTFNEAINILQDYMRRYPGSEHEAEVKELLIAAYYNSENYDMAYTALKSHPNPDNDIRAAHQKVAVFRAVESIGHGDWAMAEELLAEATTIGLVPKYNALILYWQGEVACHKGDMELAAQKYEDYIRRAPKGEQEYIFAHYGVGYAYFTLGRMTEAQKAYKDFVRDYTLRDDYLYDAHNRLGDAYFSTRSFSDARKMYRVVEQSQTEYRYYAQYQLAMVDGIESKTNSKIERLSNIVEAACGPYVDDAWYELGRTYIGAQRYADGAKTLEKFVASHGTTSPHYVHALSDLALACYNLGDKSRARGYYERVVEYDAQSSEALAAMRNIREIYVSEGRVDDYFAYAERSGVQSDMSAAARDSLTFAAAKSLYLSGDMSAACEKLQGYLSSFESGYNRTEALFYLSDCHVALGNNDAALATMKQLIDHGTSQYSERVLGVYARMSFDEGRYEESARAWLMLRDYVHSSDKIKEAIDGYVEAMLCYAKGDELLAMAEKVLSEKEVSAWSRRQAIKSKADVLRERGDRDRAMQLYEELAVDRMTVEGAEAYYRLVENDYLRGDYAGAERRVYNLGDCCSVYWQAKMFIILGDVLVKMDNKFQARATYQSIVDGYSPNDDGIVAEARARIAALSK